MRYYSRKLRSSLTLLLFSPLSTLAVSTPTTLFTLPGPVAPQSWFENLAVRPNGLILATRGDAAEIWQIDPSTGDGVLLVTVAGTYNLTGIAEVTPPASACSTHRSRRAIGQAKSCTPKETYVFGSSHIPAPLQVEPGSAKVWTLQFSEDNNTPTVSLLAALPNAGFINGIAAFGPGRDRVLLSDTQAEAVYLMDVRSGEYTTPLTSMAGINGIKSSPAQGSGRYYYLYWANHAAASLSLVPVDPTTAVAAGPAEVLAGNQSIDDFAIRVDESGKGKAYIAAQYENAVVEVTFGPAPSSGAGTTRLVAGNLSGTGYGFVSAVVFGRRKEDKGLLYAAVGQGGGSASVVVLDPSQ
ncbi:hypothetical protein C8A03DRAFT_35802 [Achaetomium macrosporum]|uniref:Uncharacterized protein n=1 Tax=Achaetomium macrosporum TaxID=79813 RepID=A0AAN7C6V2_9PEZI|nr:hypothetical protein C8A03DRAFT_35802 [Achaetomium macrosporum]